MYLSPCGAIRNSVRRHGAAFASESAMFMVAMFCARCVLARLWEADCLEVFLTVNPALLAIDANLQPHVSIHAKGDCLCILTPLHRYPGFKVFDLALWL